MKMGSMIVSVLKTCHGCHVATISHGAMLPLQILQVGIHYKCQMGKTIRPDLCCSLCFILHVLRLLENHICTRVFAQTERKLRGRGTPHTEGPQKHLECCGSREWFPCSFKGKKPELKLLVLWVFVSTSRNSAERYEDESWNTILMHIWSRDWQQPHVDMYILEVQDTCFVRANDF